MLALPVNDSFEQRMQIAFIFTATCWAFWWNIQWKRVMGFWVRPPNRPWVQVLFRAFFALSFLGALSRLLQELREDSLARWDIIPTVLIAVIMCIAVTLISAFGLWMIERRDRNADIQVE